MTDKLTERARHFFNFAPDAIVPDGCFHIIGDLEAAELAYRNASCYGERQDAQQRVKDIYQRVHDMMTPPMSQICPCCGRSR